MKHEIKRTLERQLRYIGFSQSQAKAAVAVTTKVLMEFKKEEALRCKMGERIKYTR